MPKFIFDCCCFFFSFFETQGQQANAKAHEAVDHLASFLSLSSREEISHLGIEPPTSV